MLSQDLTAMAAGLMLYAESQGTGYALRFTKAYANKLEEMDEAIS